MKVVLTKTTLMMLVLFPAILSSTVHVIHLRPNVSNATIVVPDNFASIQEAIDNAVEGSTIYVRAGVYHEHITVYKNGLKLIGEGQNVTIIDGDKLSKVVYIIANDTVITGFTIRNSGSKHYGDGGIYLEHSFNSSIFGNIVMDNNFGIFIDFSSKISIYNNSIFNNSACGIHVRNSLNIDIQNNYIKNVWPIMFFRSSRSHITNNDIRSHHPSGISLYDRSDNNIVMNNKIHGVKGDEPCTAIRSLWSLNNLYVNNVITRARWGIYLGYANGTIVANNNISEVEMWAMALYHAYNNSIINNHIDHIMLSNEVGGIFLGFSKNNLVQGNIVSKVDRGISLHFQSNDNKIVNNNFSLASIGIVLDGVSGNTIYRNNFIKNIIQGCDDGDNRWNYMGEGNYWSDYTGIDINRDGIGDSPYYILPKGTDYYPLTVAIKIESITLPRLQLVAHAKPLPEPIEVREKVTWSNKHIKLIRSINILEEGSLTLENITLVVDIDTWEPFIVVDSGGTLSIYNSTIIANGKAIWIEKNAIFYMENSRLYNAGNWEGGGAIRVREGRIVIKNSIIENSFHIQIEGGSDHQIVGNEFRYCYASIRGFMYKNSTIANNMVISTASHAMEIGASNSMIFGNTIRHVWGSPINIHGDGNVIYRNNFIGFRQKPHDFGMENLWDYKGEGNYWSDYNKGDENEDGIGDVPYYISPNGIDRYPLMVPIGIKHNKLEIHCVSGDGDSLSKSTVELRGFANHLIRTKNTNATGWVKFTSLIPNSYLITAYWHGIQVANHYVNVTSDAIIDPLRCRVHDYYVHISDRENENIENANITLYFANGTYLTSTLTNITGWAEFKDLPSTAYNIRILYQGIQLSNFTNILSIEDQIDSAFLSVYDWNVRLLDGDDKALSNAEVEVYLWDGSLLKRLTTNDEGLIRMLNYPPRSYIFKVYWMGVKVLDRDLSLMSEEQIDNIQCAVYDLLVHVVSEKNDDLPNAVVTLFWLNGTKIFTIPANSTGYVMFENIPSTTYSIKVTLKGYKDVKENITLISEDQLTTITLQSLSRPFTLTPIGIAIIASVAICGITAIVVILIKKRRSLCHINDYTAIICIQRRFKRSVTKSNSL